MNEDQILAIALDMEESEDCTIGQCPVYLREAGFPASKENIDRLWDVIKPKGKKAHVRSLG